MPDDSHTSEYDPDLSSELKATLVPCPFCGGPGAIKDNAKAGRWLRDHRQADALPDTWFIQCLQCGAQGPACWTGVEGWGQDGREVHDGSMLDDKPVPESMREAVLRWNKRPVGG